MKPLEPPSSARCLIVPFPSYESEMLLISTLNRVVPKIAKNFPKVAQVIFSKSWHQQTII